MSADDWASPVYVATVTILNGQKFEDDIQGAISVFRPLAEALIKWSKHYEDYEAIEAGGLGLFDHGYAEEEQRLAVIAAWRALVGDA